MGKKLTYDFVKSEFEKRGYELLDKEYINAHMKMNYKCLKHPLEILSISYTHLQRGEGCKYCAKESYNKKRKLSYDEVNKAFEASGYELLDKTYLNNKTKLKYKCLKHPDKELYISYDNLLHGHGCPYCKFKSTSFPEQLIYYYFKQKFKKVYNRYKIDGIEFDIYIKDINLAIEYNGSRWHTKKNEKKDKQKLLYCQDNNIDILIIKGHTKDNFIVWVSDNSFIVPEKYNFSVFQGLIQNIVLYINNKYKIFLDGDVPKDIYKKVLININIEKNKKSILSTHPQECLDWDYVKNASLKPEFFTSSSYTKVYWKCHICSFEWKQSIRGKINYRSCKQCVPLVFYNQKPVIQYDLNNHIIKEFSSVSSAARSLNKESRTLISKCCQGKIKTAYGYIWKYKEDKGCD